MSNPHPYNKDMSAANAVIAALGKTDMPVARIAERAGCSRPYVRKRIRELNLRKTTPPSEAVDKDADKDEAWQDPQDPPAPPDLDAKARKCLVCGKEFLSAHSLNRICPSCRAIQRKHNDVPEAHLYY